MIGIDIGGANLKVVDDNGDPLIVYHGTTADFTDFKKGLKKSEILEKYDLASESVYDNFFTLSLMTKFSQSAPRSVLDSIG